MTLRPIPWRRWLLLLTILAMDATWLAPWAMLLTGVRRGLSPGGMFALLIAALVTTQGLAASRLALGLQQAAAGALAILAGLGVTGAILYGGYPFLGLAWVPAWFGDLAALRSTGLGGLILTVVALYAWGRAISLVQRLPAAEAVGYDFRVGVVAWFWFHLIGLFVGADAPLPWLFLFFALGLLAIGVARVEEAQRDRGAVRSAFTPSWALLLAGGSIAAVGAGLLATLVFSRALVAAIWRALKPIAVLLRWVLYGVVWLVFLVAEPLANLLYRTLVSSEQGPLRIATPPAPTSPLPVPGSTGLPAPVRAILWAAAGLVALAIVALVVAGLQQREGEPAIEAGREAISEATGGEGTDLGAALRKLRRRMGQRLAGLRPGAYALASVRQIYASLLRLASQQGVARDAAETPYEFRLRLGSAWPAVQEQVEMLTEAYVRVRYGGRRITGKELEALRLAWERLRENVEQRGTRP